jgi:hypothetical protein
LDALAFVSDPIGSLLQCGVAWIIDHVKPLSEALDWLAGDPGEMPPGTAAPAVPSASIGHRRSSRFGPLFQTIAHRSATRRR